MSKIAILTDSSCDIPQELAEKYGIDIMSFHILLDDVDYIERDVFPPDGTASAAGGLRRGHCAACAYFAGHGSAAPVLLSVPLPHGCGVRPAAGAEGRINSAGDATSSL